MNEPLITRIDALPPELAASASAEEKAYISSLEKRHPHLAGVTPNSAMPFGVTPYFASLAKAERNDPIRRQFFPDPREGESDPFALADPLGAEKHHAVLPGTAASDGAVVRRLVHQYRDRALLLAGGACAGYCRHCFRRVWLAESPPFISGDELERALAYLSARAEIREVLISGGDPLTADNARLADLFYKLRQARPGVLLRVCTRAPVTEPSRLCAQTIALFREFRPLRLSVQINHPRELRPPPGAEPSDMELSSMKAPCSAGKQLAACVDAGIPVHVQTVLLRGVNDNANVLAELFRGCLDLGLTPYYLFQLDLAPGTAHFRVPLKEGLAIYRELGRLVSGLGLPVYAVDLPGGGGKIRLHDGVIAGEKTNPSGKIYLLKDADGKLWEYPYC